MYIFMALLLYLKLTIQIQFRNFHLSLSVGNQFLQIDYIQRPE